MFVFILGIFMTLNQIVHAVTVGILLPVAFFALFLEEETLYHTASTIDENEVDVVEEDDALENFHERI